MVQRSKTGHVAEVRLPGEIRAVRLNRIESRAVAEKARPGAHAAVNIEQVDFLHSMPLRKAIHARERGHCFYCLRRTTPMVQCLDHVVPQARFGATPTATWSPAAWNATRKRERPAANFLRRSTATAA